MGIELTVKDEWEKFRTGLDSETVLSLSSVAVCRTQPGEVKQLFEPLVKTFVDSP